MDPSFYQQFPVIETSRLVLRELTRADATCVFEAFSDPEVTRFYDVATMTDLEQARIVTDKLQRRFPDRNGVRWAIVRRSDGAMVGTCGYPVIVPGAHRGSIGYELVRSAWGSGLASEAVAAIVDFGHRNIGLHRIDALVVTGNTASAHVLRKCGFAHEGTLAGYAIIQGAYCDMDMFAHVQRAD